MTSGIGGAVADKSSPSVSSSAVPQGGATKTTSAASGAGGRSERSAS